MDLELWKGPRVIVAIVLSLIIVRVACKRNQTTNRPPVVSYTIPWVGSALDLGKDPDAFLKRAMYVEQLFTRLEAGDKLLTFSTTSVCVGLFTALTRFDSIRFKKCDFAQISEQ